MLSLCLHLSSFNLYHLISTVDVILWFRLFINSVSRLCSCSTHILFDNKLELVFCKLGSKYSRVFYTHFEHSIGIRAGALAVV